MGREINSTTLNIECIASLLGNSMIGDYKFSLSCVQSLLYSLTCTEQEKKLVELPFYASASTDKFR